MLEMFQYILSLINPTIAFFVVFSIVVFVHELGHFASAKFFGIRVFEFGMGFGPTLLKKRFKDTVYSLNLIPFGGFVKIAGIDSDEELTEPILPEESFSSLSFIKKMVIIAAGPIMNIFTALVVFTLLFSIIGVPSGVSNVIDDVFQGTPAFKAGIKKGDKILKVNDYITHDMGKAIEMINNSNGEEISLSINRDKSTIIIKLKGKMDPESKKYYIGIRLASKGNIRYNPFAALRMGFVDVYYLSKLVIAGLFSFFTGKVPVDQISGPIGIAQITAQVTRQGLISVINLLAFLSINIGFLNLLPFPALDGGRLCFLLIEGVFGKDSIVAKYENKIHYVGFVILMFLLLLVSYQDILKLFK